MYVNMHSKRHALLFENHWLICLLHYYFGCYSYCHMTVLLCAAYTPVCSQSVCFLGVWSIYNRRGHWIRHKNDYHTPATHNIHSKIILLKCTNRDVNNSDETECCDKNQNRRIVSPYSIKLEKGFSLLNELGPTKSCHWFHVSHTVKWRVGLQWLYRADEASDVSWYTQKYFLSNKFLKEDIIKFGEI
jgi:hypothetical protein